MSTTMSPRPVASVQPTRQQLDELDALLKRMLDLPVAPTETEPTPAPALSEAADPPTPTEHAAAEPMPSYYAPPPLPDSESVY